jgi:hypothetical protein
MGFVGDAVKGIGKGIGWAADKITDIPVLGGIARGIPLVGQGLSAADAMYDMLGGGGGGGGSMQQMANMGGYPQQGGGGGGGGVDWGKLLPMILGGGASIYGAVDANKDSSRARELAEAAITTAQGNQQQGQERWDKYSPVYEQGIANMGPSENPFYSNPLAGLSNMGQAPTRQAAPPRVSQGAVSAATTGIQGPANIPGWSGADIQAGARTPPWEGYGDTSRGIGGVYQDLNKLFDPSRFQSQPQQQTPIMQQEFGQPGQQKTLDLMRRMF